MSSKPYLNPSRPVEIVQPKRSRFGYITEWFVFVTFATALWAVQALGDKRRKDIGDPY